MDAFTQAGAIGLARGKAMYLNKKRMLQAMQATAAAQERYASTGDINQADFTAEERNQSKE
jgi:hypothetical protein